MAGVIATAVLYSLNFGSLLNLLPSSPLRQTSFPPASSRLLRFSPHHAEWVSASALEFLSQFRDAVDAEGKWIARSPSHIDVAALRAQDRAGVLNGLSEMAIKELAGRDGYRVGYIDATDLHLCDKGTNKRLKEKTEALPYRPVNTTAHPESKMLVDMVSADELRYIVGNLSVRFPTRYYRSVNARAPAQYIKEYLSRIPNTTVSLFENRFDQPNVLARLEPPNTSIHSPTILLAGHLDSTSPIALFRAPGADDDASGTAVMMHVMDILSRSGWVQTRAKYPIEGHAYAGEEGGLLGSSAVAHAYKTSDRSLRGMLNLEMVGWQPEKNGSSTITVLVDPDEEMAVYMRDVIGAYIPTSDVRSTTCGYGCSDHYSWSSLGYPVVCLASYGPKDDNLNPNYHSTGDTIDKLDFERMADFARASIAWVIQVGSL